MRETKERKINKVYILLSIIIVFLIGLCLYNYYERIKAEKVVIQTGVESLEGLEEAFLFYENYQGSLSLNEKAKVSNYIGMLANNAQKGIDLSDYKGLEGNNLKLSLENVIKINDREITLKVVKELRSLNGVLKEVNDKGKKYGRAFGGSKEDNKKIIEIVKNLSSFNN